MSYQTFGDVAGASSSPAKLEALKLDRLGSLVGKSVLDLGCNEGFFCGEMLRLGAERVVGIDRSAPWIKSAQERFPKAEFRVGSWWDLPDEKFDIILFLSAVHYEQNQKALFQKLAGHLKDTGTIVLECGLAATDHATESWLQIYRNDNLPKRYPVARYLSEHILSDYVVVSRGPSVPQKGDPISRWVLHCQKRRPTVVIVSGKSGDGKTVMSSSFGKAGVPVYRLDALMSRLLTDVRYEKTPLAKMLRNLNVENSASLISKIISQEEQELALAEIIVDEAPIEAEVCILEGEAFIHLGITTAIVKLLEDKGAVVWLSGRVSSQSTENL